MYEINYNDERFKEVETDRKEALSENEKLYGGMVNEADKYYQAQIDASKQWATEQQKLQQEKTDFAIEKIEQQKAQATKDYKKEQSGAYVDWQKESNRYGANAEQMASQGLANSGYAESSQVSLFNAYQNRVATAREAHNIIIMNYNNGIKDAMLQNNSALAEIRKNALQQQLELSLQGFQYKNTLLTEKANQKAQIENRFDNKYQAVLDQMNKENALAEEVRQYNQNYQLELNKYNESVRQFNASLAEEQRQYNASLAARSSGGSGGSGGGSGSGGSGGSGQLGGGNEVSTAYYQGDKNKDADTYGTFSNGYQPKGIAGYGKVKDSGKDVELETETLYGQKQTVVQTVWKTNDGSLWYWEGRDNEYKKIGNGTKQNQGSAKRQTK